MEDDKHSREVLISLRKRYSRDEAVAIIFRRLADTETELGIVNPHYSSKNRNNVCKALSLSK